MSTVKVETPNHDEVETWIKRTVIPDDKVIPLAQKLGEIGAKTMRRIFRQTTKFKNRNRTVRTIRWWWLTKWRSMSIIGIGSKSRGDVLRWQDRGRGEVRPVKAPCLHYWIGNEEIFSMYSRPASAKFIFAKTLNSIKSRINQIIYEVLHH